MKLKNLLLSNSCFCFIHKYFCKSICFILISFNFLSSRILHFFGVSRLRFFWGNFNCFWSLLVNKSRSIFGPLLFALFISSLADITTPTTYADDNFGSGRTKKFWKTALMKQSLQWSGFWTVVFVSTKKQKFAFFIEMTKLNEVNFNSEKINVLKNIEILGLIFDSKLNWYTQIVNAIEKANKAKQAFISGYFSTKEIVNCELLCFTTDFTMGPKSLDILQSMKKLKKTTKKATTNQHPHLILVNYQHWNVYDEWLKAIMAFNFI